MNLNQDKVLYEINSFRIDYKYTDTVLKFSEGHIYVHWIILEANKTSVKWLRVAMPFLETENMVDPCQRH